MFAPGQFSRKRNEPGEEVLFLERALEDEEERIKPINLPKSFLNYTIYIFYNVH
jgi:hypothetical protein